MHPAVKTHSRVFYFHRRKFSPDEIGSDNRTRHCAGIDQQRSHREQPRDCLCSALNFVARKSIIFISSICEAASHMRELRKKFGLRRARTAHSKLFYSDDPN